ncbi:MAG: sulfatase [bacterium]|nr:sulfatase [bacterium]
MNLVVVCTDTWRSDYLGCYGNDWIQTPNLDRLASEGVLFRNFYAEALPTLCARTVFYTGRHLWPGWEVREHRGDNLGYQPGWHQVPEASVTLAEALQKTGYTTALVSDLYHQFKPTGNWHRGFYSWEWIRGQEQDRYITGPREAVDLSPYMREGTYEQRRFQGLEQYLLNQLDRKEEADYLCAQVLQKAGDWVRRNGRNQPFMLWCECFDPHEPWDPPQEYADRYCPDYEGPEWISPPGEVSQVSGMELDRIRALYAGECSLVDTWVGHLFGVLKKEDLWDDTAVVFVSDHGTNLGERGMIRKRPWTLESQETRLPLIVRHPDTGFAGQKVDALLHAPDLAPTLLKLLGQDVPETMTGQDFWPVVTGEVEGLHEEVVSAYGPYAALRNREWLYTTRYAAEGAMGRAETVPPRLSRTEAELEDVGEAFPEVMEEMEAQLRKRLEQPG